MLAKGYVKTFDEAFDKWLAHGKPGYVPKPKWTLEEAIAAIRTAGGLSVIAHPVWYKDPEQVVATGVAAGLDGLEVYHLDQAGKENEFGRLARAPRPPEVRGLGLPRPGGGEAARRRVPSRRGRMGADGRRRARAPARESGRPPLDLTPR